MNEIIELAKKMGQMLKDSEEFKKYEEVKARYETDSELQMQIGEFNLRKMAVMNEMEKEDKDNEKFERLQNEMREAYKVAMSNPLMGEFMKTKETFESLVNNVYSIINFQITGETGSCDKSNCASCGGGCH
ncbi:MAG: YlbF family regulator [Ruminococcaceae bacterium]|nr:YlbF family regulator [Oscillospiraceae bacterium]